MQVLTRRFLVSCSFAALVQGILASPVLAMPITKQLVVDVVTVCDNGGANCAWSGPAGDSYFEAEADKIWAQAGIDIKFVTLANLNDSSKLNGKAGVADFTSALGGPGTTMYLVNTLACSGCTLWGEAWLNAGGLVINMTGVQDFSAAGRIDTIAHELGHNLGLDHDSSNADFLIAPGSVRNVPNSLADIAPDGLGYDLLSADQIATAQASRLLVDYSPTVPEPGSLALMVAAFLGAGVARRRR